MQLSKQYPNESKCSLKADGSTCHVELLVNLKRKHDLIDDSNVIDMNDNEVIDLDSYLLENNVELLDTSFTSTTRTVKVNGVEKEIMHIEID